MASSGGPSFSMSNLSTQEQALLSPREQVEIQDTQSQAKRHFSRAIGMNGIWVLIVGSLANLAAVTILAILWEGARRSRSGGKVPTIWENILSSGWLSRTITLASMAVRTAISLQASLCAAMLAALLLETFETPLYIAPVISMMRHSSGGPYNLFWMISNGSFRGTRSGYLILAVAISLTTFASNFTSTILFSDLGTGSFTGTSDVAQVAFGINKTTRGLLQYRGVDYWKARPASYPTFAEYSEPPVVHSGVKDTGITLRAFLPYANPDERMSLRDFLGETSILDARVTCVKPIIEAKTALVYGVANETVFISIFGTLTYSTPLPMLELPGGSYRATFNCSVPLADKSNTQRSILEWTVSICFLKATSTGGMLGSLYNSIQFGEELFVFNSTGTYNQYAPAMGPVYENITTLANQNSNEWLDIVVPQTKKKLSATLCFKYKWVGNYKLKIRGTSERIEPLMRWNSDSHEYDTEDTRKMLGVTAGNYSLSERGVLDLMKYEGPANNNTLNFAVTTNTRSGIAILSLFPNNSLSYLMCSYCGNNGPGTLDPHRFHVALFQDILTTTKNPALAVQALYTTITQMSYYDFLPEFDISGPATVESSSEMLMPLQWIGFSVVIAIICLHTILVVITTILFVRGTTISLLGDHWQAIAQSSKGETEMVIQNLRCPTNKEARKFLKMTGLNTSFVGLGKSPHSGSPNMVITRRRPTYESPLRSA